MYNKGDSEPSYSGSTPTRPNDSNYSYTFSGWNLVSSTNTTKTYQAQYTSVAKITVTWQNWDNSILQTKTYFANESEPSYSGTTPTRPDDIPSSGNGTRYTFSSWILVSSSSNSKVYQAQFSTQVLYIWDRYTIEDGNTYDRRSVYGHSWDEEDWNDGYATIDAVGDDTFDYCAKYQQSYTNNTTFKSNLLNSAFDSLVKKI